MKKILLIILLLKGTTFYSQSFLMNTGFESYTSCPVGLGEVYKAVSWYMVIQSPDYYNCTYTSDPAYPTTSGASSGTGFVGFASYGDSNGSAEAIGQDLAQPLLPGHSYTLSVDAKKASGGVWSSTCGGIAIYGFKDTIATGMSTIHASQIPNAVLLGISATVQDIAWQTFTFNFIPSDTINHVVFTVQVSSLCTECIFMDNADIQNLESNSIAAFKNVIDFNIYPNPATDNLNISISNPDFKNAVITITNIQGEKILSFILDKSIKTIDISGLSKGMYFVESIVDEKRSVMKMVKE